MDESEEAKITRFASGLRRDIQDVVELQEYSSLGSLVHLAMKVESQHAKKMLSKTLPMMVTTTSLGKIKKHFQNILRRILLSNLRSLNLLLLLLNHQSNRLVRNALNVWDMVTLLLIFLLKGICMWIMAL